MDEKQTPIEITNALAVIAALRTNAPDRNDLDALAKALPPLAQRLARNEMDASIETLRTHADQGVDHVRDLYESLGAPPKNQKQKTYEDIVKSFPLPIEQKFIDAAQNGDMDRVQSIIQKGSIDFTADDRVCYGTALIHAASNGHIDIVRLLIAHDAAIDSINESALRCAAAKSRIDIVRLLIERGVNIHANNGAALRHAAENGQIDILRLLIKHGADITANDSWALREAAANGHIKIARLLVKRGADINTKDSWALRLAIKNGHIAIVKLLIKHNANISDEVLLTAAENGNIRIVRLLLKHNTDIHANHDMALRAAAINGRIDIFKLLIKHNANISDAILSTAAASGHINIVRLIIKQKSHLTKHIGHTANNDCELTREWTTRSGLEWAASNGHTNIVRLLIKHGVIPHTNDDWALRAAAGNGHTAIVKLLIKHKANIHAKNDEALRVAVEHGHIDVIKLLIKHGADVRANSDAALRFASVKGRADIVELLIKHGANVHAENEEALRVSATADVTRILIENGADFHTNNESPLRLAVRKRNADIIKLLIAHGARTECLLQETQEQIQGVMRWGNIHGYATIPTSITAKDPTLIKRSVLDTVAAILVQEGYPENMAYPYAYNAAALFGTESRILQYLEKWGAHGNQPLHNVIQMISIPSPKAIGDGQSLDLKSWGDAVLQCGPEMAKFVKFSHRLPRPAQDRSGRFWSLKNTKEIIADYAYKNAHKNPELSLIALDCAWDDEDFDAALKTIKKYQKTYAANDNKKPADAIPDITIDGAAFGKDGFTFHRLPDGDIRGLALGAFTACCQHIGGAVRAVNARNTVSSRPRPRFTLSPTTKPIRSLPKAGRGVERKASWSSIPWNICPARWM
ncbi:ankyrin repeat domain-containing protein [Micavibrio aeruginosavorus]|uniref:Ankyrin containing protein n=1 Tax=Micavibrio aeruginosavorus EPB TaxID=349215 RepID=M4VEQ5_9BACT|nr:ankyrin repeat domain-containing protein [Micavibrio aeruginosavorus]AGH97872.1 ankyrin containing protein [Micavibrio aeruginosavorus EPB]